MAVFQTAETHNLRIREFVQNDRDSLLDFVRTPGQLRYMMFNMETEKDVDDLLSYAKGQILSAGRIEWHFAIEEKDRDGCIGGVALMKKSESDTSAEIGYWLKQPYWGKGYATEASMFMLEFGFKNLGLHRIWGKCHIDNTASAKVMEKLGMTFEGKIREHVWLRDHWRSSLQFSILESEFTIK
ncbi:MAG: GNAT family N-acetyltransferase [Fibrobacteres bacterium]|nr:GNAT family N-acetyltransferase [Fibrobacterota bacterium]